ncbi:MAG: hypothetical protein L3J39_01200 [Verrucomicrobiales bacterium]|nr:hypothetical protein [Verrucomicrobiales bacterium]
MKIACIIAAFIPSSKEWLHEHQTLLTWLGWASLATFLIGLTIVPLIAIRMNEDYFLYQKKPPIDSFRRQHPVVRWFTLIIKNLLGLLLVLAGIAMLALPGQGIITILLGIMLMNFPGKQKIELRIIRIPKVLHSINWIRAKAAHPPLKLPPV